jgi:hypothetical protein
MSVPGRNGWRIRICRRCWGLKTRGDCMKRRHPRSSLVVTLPYTQRKMSPIKVNVGRDSILAQASIGQLRRHTLPPCSSPHAPDHKFSDAINTLLSTFRLPPKCYMARKPYRLSTSMDTMKLLIRETGRRAKSVPYLLFFPHATVICKSLISRTR